MSYACLSVAYRAVMDDVPAWYEYMYGGMFDDFGDTKKKRSTKA